MAKKKTQKQKPQKKKNAPKKTNKTKQMRESELRRIYNECLHKATIQAMTLFFTVMHDKEGYGTTRLTRVWNAVEKLSQELEEGRVNIYDLRKTLEEEVGVYIVREDPNKTKKEGG